LTADPLDRPIPKREYTLAAIYSLVLIWINYYICREIFRTPTDSMASMHGYWIAMAERAEGSWFHLSWWPYWGCGMPFGFAYAPLVPALTAIWGALRHVPLGIAFNALTGAIYIATPVSLFLMAWILTRSPGYSFAAAAFYSLTSITQIIVPDPPFSWLNIWQAWRFTVVILWDETPHLTAVTLLPPAILLVWLSMVRPRWFYQAGAAVLIALATYASAFAPIGVMMACICVIAALDPARRGEYIRRLAGIGIAAYALAAATLPPSLITAMRSSAQSRYEGWNIGSFTAIALLFLGWAIVWIFARRIKTAPLRFFVLFAYLTAAIPILAMGLNRSFLPQPRRYRLEAEMALVLAIVFGLRPLLEKIPRVVKAGIAVAALALAIEQVDTDRLYAKVLLKPPDIESTIEYRASLWADRNLPGVRIMLPGSIAEWAADFAPIDQFAGGSWSQDPNPIHPLALEAVFHGGTTPESDARVSLLWLKAYGVSAVAVSTPGGMEYWKPYAFPHKFDGVLPALWSEGGVTFYRVPQRSTALAHVVPAAAVIRRAPLTGADTAEIERYDAALDDASLPLATFEWIGRNQIRINSTATAGQAISVQVSYHPGWHAKAGGRNIAIHRDGLGLMWLESPGPAEIILDYDGGLELRLCRAITYAAILFLLTMVIWSGDRAFRHDDAKQV